VGIEELGLGLAAVGALSIPPTGTVGSLDGDIGSRDLDERTAPLFVTESSGALEDNLFSPLKIASLHET
jgi:hypothetical protein